MDSLEPNKEKTLLCQVLTLDINLGWMLLCHVQAVANRMGGWFLSHHCQGKREGAASLG